MKAVIERTNRFLNLPLDPGTRILLVLAALVIAWTCFLPVWKVTVGPEGLRGGSSGFELAAPEADARASASTADLAGSREAPGDFREFNWVPFALGALGLLFLRAAALGTMATLVDVSVVFVYLAAFVLWSFGSRFLRYGDSRPGSGAYLIGVTLLLLGVALVLAWRQGRSEIAAEARMAG
jgi:small-conductance mechanosensitive channel